MFQPDYIRAQLDKEFIEETKKSNTGIDYYIDLKNLIATKNEDFIITNLRLIWSHCKYENDSHIYFKSIIENYDNLEVMKDILKNGDPNNKHNILMHNKHKKKLFKNLKVDETLKYFLIMSVSYNTWKFVKKYFNDDDKYSLMYSIFYSHASKNTDFNLMEKMKFDVELHYYDLVLKKLNNILNTEEKDRSDEHKKQSIDNMNILAKIFKFVLNKKRRELFRELNEYLYHPDRINKYIETHGVENLEHYLQ